MKRTWHFEGIDNFRDLGGYETSYGVSEYNVIYRCGTLVNITPNDIDKIAKMGIKTILDFCDENAINTKEDKLKQDKRFVVIDCPIEGKVSTDYENGIANYIEILEDRKQIRKILLSIINSPKPLLMHCEVGKDRTGVISALILLANGVNIDDVNENYLESFPLLARSTRLLKEKYPDYPIFPLTPNQFFFLDFYEKFVEKWIDINNYLEWLLLSDDEIELLSNILGKQEKSCGAVVFYQDEILIEHMNLGHYSLPKGHVEKIDTSDEDTALREIKEETGLNVTLVDDKQHLIYYSPKKGVAKEVKFFIAMAKEKNVIPQKEEVKEIYWLKPLDAIRCMTHDSDRKVIQWACKYKENN